MADNRDGEGGRDRREPRLRDLLARRLFTEGEDEDHPHEDRGRDDRHREDRHRDDRPREERPREERGRLDAREVLGAMLDTGDKAKTEVIRLIAREVRSYLEALQVGDDIHDLLTNYSLEVHASLHLRPLRDDEKEEERDASTPSELSAGLRRRQPKRGRRGSAPRSEPSRAEGEPQDPE